MRKRFKGKEKIKSNLNYQKFKQYFYWYIVASTFIGGTILTFHYLSIGYLPEVDFAGLSYLLYVVAITTIIIVIGLFLLFSFAGYVWRQMSKKIGLKVCYLKEGIPQFNKLFLLFVSPVLGIYSAFVFSEYRWIIVFLNVLFLSGILVFMYKKGIKSIEYMAYYVGSVAIGGLFIITFPLLLIIYSEGLQDFLELMPLNEDWSYLLLVVALSFWSSFSLETGVNGSKWHFLIFPILALFIVTNVFLGWSFIPNIVINKYQLGNIEASQVSFRKQGCQVMELLDILEYNQNGVCKVEKIKILSRLGRRAYLQINKNNKEFKFTIPSDQILSWTVKEKNKNVKTESQTSKTQPTPDKENIN